MFYFTCNESKIYEIFTFWNNLQEKINFFHDILIHWDAPVLSPFTQPEVFPNLYEFLSSAENKRRYFEECW